ncbi:DUF998 domain-containing protein [Halobellus inordinatus]|uniref:DUF998 domain-containing protein n=1 Tax=Halobellus inordinatus TaxID=1126236 RepID=UPI0021156171|nr:DUF998 domain-containing protein [Halobellus ramosii]
MTNSRVADTLMRYAAHAGPAGALVAITAILAATWRSATFSWAGSALSDLGTASGTALLFNGGLVAGGAVGIAYALALRRSSIAVASSYVLSIVSMVLVGVFPAGTPLHFPVAVAFFLLATATVSVDGWLRRATTAGRLGLALAVGHLLGWLVWLLGIRPGPGLALPELGGVVMFGGWVVFLAPPVRRGG